MSTGIWSKVIGTTLSKFRLGFAGVTLKDSSGDLVVRNSADDANSAITASQVKVSGNSIILNSAAAGSGADWAMTVARPASGMTAAKTITLPPTAGTNGQAIITDGSGNLSFATVGNTSLCEKVHSVALAFGSTSPLALLSTGATDLINMIQVVVDTPFTTGSPSLSIGVTGTASKYLGSTDVDLTAAATTLFEVSPGIAAAGAEDLIATYAAGGCTAGAARIMIYTSQPA